MIDPREIEEVEFKTTRVREGYDQTEVDDFLDRVALDYRSVLQSNAMMEQENARLKRRVAELEGRINDTPTQVIPVQQEPTEAAGRLLELAQQTADDVVAKAQQNAVDIAYRAEQNARDVAQEAKRQADEALAVAVDEAFARRRKAEAEAYKAEQDLELLRGVRSSVRSQLEDQLRDLASRLSDPERPAS